MPLRLKILLVDTQSDALDRQREWMQSLGYAVYTATSAEQAWRKASQGVDVVLLGAGLSAQTALAVTEDLWISGHDIPAVLVADIEPTDPIVQIQNRGGRCVVPRSAATLESIAIAIEKAVKRSNVTSGAQPDSHESPVAEPFGRLACRVAHEFKNQLQIIQGLTEEVHAELHGTQSLREDLTHVLDATGRAASLTNALLSFGRQCELDVEAVDLGGLSANLIEMLRKVANPAVTLEAKCSPDTWPVLGSRARLSQAILNLLLNALDAVPRGGRVSIKCENATEIPRKVQSQLFPGDFVRVDVVDTGIGIPDDHLRQIFEPFFTTKPRSQEAGLGLHVVQNVIAEHFGGIDVTTSPHEGTTFSLYLPRSAKDPQPQTPGHLKCPRGGSETLIVADDEPTIRHHITRTLTRAGYQVLPACDGGEALQLYDHHKGNVAALLLDMVMPVHSGRDVYEAIKSTPHACRCLFLTGYDTSSSYFSFGSSLAPPILTKPIRTFDLLHAVRNLLDESQ